MPPTGLGVGGLEEGACIFALCGGPYELPGCSPRPPQLRGHKRGNLLPSTPLPANLPLGDHVWNVQCLPNAGVIQVGGHGIGVDARDVPSQGTRRRSLSLLEDEKKKGGESLESSRCLQEPDVWIRAGSTSEAGFSQLASAEVSSYDQNYGPLGIANLGHEAGQQWAS